MLSFFRYSLLLLLGSASIISFAAATGKTFYVIDPYETYSDDWYLNIHNDRGYMDLNFTEPGLFGERALRMDYEVVQTENWGGFVALSWIIEGREVINCFGASHVSFNFKILKRQSSIGRVHLRLNLYDDSDCNSGCGEQSNLETYYSFHYVLDSTSDQWQEAQVPLVGDSDPNSPFWRTGWSGSVGNNKLDTNHIKGYGIELSMDSQGEMDSTSSGSLLLDQLTCVGGEDVVDWPFEGINGTYEDAVLEGLWWQPEFWSELSRNETSVFFQDGMLHVDYTMERSNDIIRLRHTSPKNGYYNLSHASEIVFDYQVIVPASHSQPYLSIALEGHKTDQEFYQQFPNMLNQTSMRAFNATLDLADQSFDASMIKGIRIELHVHSQGDDDDDDYDDDGNAGSVSTGYVSLGQLVAVLPEHSEDNAAMVAIENTACSTENNLLLISSSAVFERKEFLGGQCCETCDEDEDCLYAFASHDGDCYIASYLDNSSVALQNTALEQTQTRSYATQDARKRGDYCEVCECIEANLAIDCRGQDLAITPKTFSKEWSPEVLDLTRNPRLVLIDSKALEDISDSLTELRLPQNLLHLSLESVERLSALTQIQFEHGENNQPLNNVITGPSDFFLDVCCGLGVSMDLDLPSGGLTFCNMQADMPGIDSVYQPFVQYVEATQIARLRPSSSFLSEAAESPEKCAAFCTITEGCLYFSYDARSGEAEHTCYLLADNGTRADYVCCEPDDFSGDNTTKSGWTSGWPPRTRHDVDSAKLITAPIQLFVDSSNDYVTQFSISLGSSPLRGAVWVYPILSSTTELNVSIFPERVALYDNTTATIAVSVLNNGDISAEETLLIRHQIHSCDAAFTAVHPSEQLNEGFVYIDVHVDRLQNSMNVLVPAILVPVLVVMAILFVFVYLDLKRRRLDSVWSIKSSELHFGKSPEIIGRGTFGVVLLAEYHGTLVAVKRVIPPKDRATNSLQTGAFLKWERDESWKSMRDESLGGSNNRDDIESGGPLDSGSTVNLGMLSGTKNRGVGRGGSSSQETYTKVLFGRDAYSKLKSEFVAEMRILSKLRHPCITPIIGAVVDPREEPLLVMEYMNHGSLYNLLHNTTVDIDGEQILPILRDAAQGIRFLHATNPQVIHGDIKAQNILVSSNFRAKVCDFGLSHTRLNWLNVVGTPYFMSPELLRGETGNTSQSDVYSFGIMLFEVYSRRDPYEGEDYKRVLQLVRDPIIKKRPPVPESCPPAVASMMAACLMDDPIERPTFEHIDLHLKRMELADAQPLKDSLPAPNKEEKLRRFPPHIAKALQDGTSCDPESRELVTICFFSIARLPEIAALIGSDKTRSMIDRLEEKFEKLARGHDVFEVATIGESYMVVSNLAKDQHDHAKRMVEFAKRAILIANQTLIDAEGPGLGSARILVGMHSGPVVASVVGSRNPRYCLFGDTVNTAFEIHSQSLENRIHCSEFSARLLRKQHPEALRERCRGFLEGKWKKEMKTYFLKEQGWDEINAPEEERSHSFSVASTVEKDSTVGENLVRSNEGIEPVCEMTRTVTVTVSDSPFVAHTNEEKDATYIENLLRPSEQAQTYCSMPKTQERRLGTDTTLEKDSSSSENPVRPDKHTEPWSAIPTSVTLSDKPFSANRLPDYLE